MGIPEKELKQIQIDETNRDRQEKDIKQLKHDITRLHNELEYAKNHLVTQINTMNNRINECFRDLMEKMSFAGEVILKEGGHDSPVYDGLARTDSGSISVC